MSATPTPEAATAGSRFPPTRANREPSGSGAGTRGEGPLEEFEYPSPLAVLIGGGAAAALVVSWGSLVRARYRPSIAAKEPCKCSDCCFPRRRILGLVLLPTRTLLVC